MIFLNRIDLLPARQIYGMVEDPLTAACWDMSKGKGNGMLVRAKQFTFFKLLLGIPVTRYTFCASLSTLLTMAMP